MLVETLEQRILRVNGLQMGATILTGIGLLHLTAVGIGDVLRTVADTQYRHLAYKLAEVNLESLWVVNGKR